MKNYAVVKIKGSQYKVREGDEILVDKIGTDKPVYDVLLKTISGKLKIGKPTIKGATIKFKVINLEEKGKKLHVNKFKAKSRYRKKIGFRPLYTRLLVQKIA